MNRAAKLLATHPSTHPTLGLHDCDGKEDHWLCHRISEVQRTFHAAYIKRDEVLKALPEKISAEHQRACQNMKFSGSLLDATTLALRLYCTSLHRCQVPTKSGQPCLNSLLSGLQICQRHKAWRNPSPQCLYDMNGLRCRSLVDWEHPICNEHKTLTIDSLAKVEDACDALLAEWRHVSERRQASKEREDRLREIREELRLHRLRIDSIRKERATTSGIRIFAADRLLPLNSVATVSHTPSIPTITTVKERLLASYKLDRHIVNNEKPTEPDDKCMVCIWSAWRT